MSGSPCCTARSKLNKFEHVQEGPCTSLNKLWPVQGGGGAGTLYKDCPLTDRHDWKHYLRYSVLRCSYLLTVQWTLPKTSFYQKYVNVTIVNYDNHCQLWYGDLICHWTNDTVQYFIEVIWASSRYLNWPPSKPHYSHQNPDVALKSILTSSWLDQW